MLEQQIEQDIKTAQLQGDSLRLTTLRGVKASLLNVKVATGKRDSGLGDDEVLAVLAKEAKKRQESADIYAQAGVAERADAELAEKVIIDAYLPTPLNEAELRDIVDSVITELGASGPQAMGQIIGMVKSRAGAGADGGLIARLVKEKLQ